MTRIKPRPQVTSSDLTRVISVNPRLSFRFLPSFCRWFGLFEAKPKCSSLSFFTRLLSGPPAEVFSKALVSCLNVNL